MYSGETCPQCGQKFFNLKAHQGKRPCRAAAASWELQTRGYARADELLRRINFPEIPKSFKRFVLSVNSGHDPNWSRSIFEEEWLPKWVCALIVEGHWTAESISNVEKNKELQIAFAMEYDLR